MPLGLKSGHARAPTPLGASPSFSYPGGGICRRPGWLPNIRLQMRLPKGIMFQVQFLSRKTRYFPPNLGSWTHFLGAPWGVPKNDPGEHHRLSFSTLAKYALLMFFGWHWPPQRTPTRARIMSISGLGLGFRTRLKAWKTQKSL